MIETLKAVVHPWHCDVMGHLCTRHYVGFFDDAAFHLVAACGGHVVSSAEANPTNGYADVKALYEYRAEVGAGELITVSSAITWLGNSSFSASHKMNKVSDASLVATAETTSVCFDLEARKAIPIPANFRTKAEELFWVTQG